MLSPAPDPVWLCTVPGQLRARESSIEDSSARESCTKGSIHRSEASLAARKLHNIRRGEELQMTSYQEVKSQWDRWVWDVIQETKSFSCLQIGACRLNMYLHPQNRGREGFSLNRRSKDSGGGQGILSMQIKIIICKQTNKIVKTFTCKT